MALPTHIQLQIVSADRSLVNWTTLIYALVQPNGLSLLNWLFLLGALLIDLGTWGVGFFASRKEYSSYRGT